MDWRKISNWKSTLPPSMFSWSDVKAKVSRAAYPMAEHMDGHAVRGREPLRCQKRSSARCRHVRGRHVRDATHVCTKGDACKSVATLTSGNYGKPAIPRVASLASSGTAKNQAEPQRGIALDLCARHVHSMPSNEGRPRKASFDTNNTKHRRLLCNDLAKILGKWMYLARTQSTRRDTVSHPI